MNPRHTGAPWLIGGLTYIGGAIIYILRIPEKLYPVKFDLIGHSHNLFHIAILLGYAIHFNESMNLYLERLKFVCPI